MIRWCLFFVLVVLCSIGCNAVSSEHLIKDQWEGFKLEHDKMYENEAEEEYRFRIFTENLDYINNHNKQYDMGLSTYYVGINQFADLSHAEFLEIYSMNGVNNTEYEMYIENDSEEIPVSSDTYSEEELTDQMDWRARGAVTGIKSQGECGSCWAFASNAALEAYWFIKRRHLVSLSEQNLLDCSRENLGCRYGWVTKTFDYIIRNRGVDTESSYRYVGVQRQCQFRRNTVGATLRSYQNIRSGDENALKGVVARTGPVTVNIDISDPGFRFFRGGVYNNPRCGRSGGHFVLVIGFGNERRTDYWLIKNSWGTTWGEHGFGKMTRNSRNQCGIATFAVYPVV